jgi:F420-dependent oxidoreductase-like protein
MRFGIWAAPSWSWPETLAVARHCQQTGWDSVYFADHFMPNAPEGDEPLDGETLECWSVLAALAATVPRVRLAPLVTSVTYRHPAVLANMAAAVDRISEGRLVLGLGAGWQLNEHAAYGIELGSVRERLDRFEEAVQVVTSLLRRPRTTFDGDYYRLSEAPNQPPPVQEKVPILIGGGGERRTLRIAARYADEWNTWSTPDVLRHKTEVLAGHCQALGRDPAEVSVSTQALTFVSVDSAEVARVSAMDFGRAAAVGTPAQMVDLLGLYAEAGADEYIVPGFTLNDPARRLEFCDLFIEEVAPALR